jgi:hypothetical protein
MVNRFDIVGAFRDLATAKGWKFLYGYDQYINAQDDFYDTGELVLACEMTINPVLEPQGGAIDTVNFSGIVMLGRKFEAVTTASLDESMIQKHDRRLAELWELLTSELSNMACSNGFTIRLSNGIPLINFTMHDIDFVKYSIIIEG